MKFYRKKKFYIHIPKFQKTFINKPKKSKTVMFYWLSCLVSEVEQFKRTKRRKNFLERVLYSICCQRFLTFYIVQKMYL